MSYDPQNEPEFWTHELRRFTDTTGTTLVEYENQDGEVFVMDADEYDGKIDL